MKWVGTDTLELTPSTPRLPPQEEHLNSDESRLQNEFFSKNIESYVMYKLLTLGALPYNISLEFRFTILKIVMERTCNWTLDFSNVAVVARIIRCTVKITMTSV